MLSIDENVDSAWVKYFSYISFEEIENKHRGEMGRGDRTPVTGLTPPHVCVSPRLGLAFPIPYVVDVFSCLK